MAVPISVVLLTSACGRSGTGAEGAAAGATDASISINNTEPENPLVPGNTTEVGGGKVVRALFEGLVEYDTATAEPRNAVAESITTTDSEVYTITLKPGWTFHDGTPVIAKSFADAWNYTAYSPNAQQSASFFTQIQGFTDVNTKDPDGAGGPQKAPTPKAKEMSGLRVVDDRTLQVTLTEPFSVFPTQLGYSAFAPLPASFFTDKAAFEATPIGNGPFRFVSRQPGASITLERYDAYAGERRPTVKTVEFRVYESAEAAYADVVSNNLDFLDNIPPSAIAGSLFTTDLAQRNVSQTYLGVQTVSFPVYDARYQDPKLRQALSMAVDRDAVNKQIFNGLKVPADGFVAPKVPGRAEGQCGELCTYQPAKAKALFEATGFQGPVQLTSNADAGNKEWMQAACVTISSALGRECTFVPVPTFGEFRTAINAGKMTAPYRSGWIADYPSIENFMNPLYRTGGSSNDGGYSNPAVDAMLARADAAITREAGNALYQEAERLVVQDMPAIPLYFRSVQAGWSDRLAGAAVNQFRELDLLTVTVK